MITRLYVEGYEVDLIQDIDVDFTFSISDIQDIEKRTTSYSKTIAIPHTPKNANIFGHIYDISVENDYNPLLPNININFNPAKQAKAVLYVENVRVFDGVIRLINISNKQGEIIYECNLFGKLKDILYALGDKLIEEIDFSDYNHILNIANMQSSWGNAQWVDGANNYVYPLADYGYPSIAVQNYDYQNFKPALFVREVVKRMFDDAGFKIDTGFFDTAYFKKLILVKGDRFTKPISEFLNSFRNTFSVSTTSQTGFLSLPTNVTNEGFTINGTFDRWTSTRPTFKATIALTADNVTILNFGNPSFSATATFTIYKNGIATSATGVVVAVTPTYSTNNFVISTELDITTGDFFEVYYNFNVSGIGVNPANFIVTKPRIRIYNALAQEYPIAYGSNVTFNDVLPKQIKQRDFLKSLILMHNIYVEADPVQDNLLNFVPYPLYYETDKAQAIDWSRKLDVSQPIKIIPLGELTAREYNIGYTQDNDYWGQLYQTKFNDTYGDYKRLVDNDFELDTKNINVLFGTPTMVEDAYDKKMLHLYKVQNNIKQPDNFKPRIALWKNISSISWGLEYPTGVLTLNNCPYAGHLDDPNTPTIDICFGTPQEVYFAITSYPSANLGNTYYSDFFDSITDKDSKLLQGYFYLTPLDINNLEFNSLIKVGNHYFRIQKIEQYNPYANGLCLVTLIKIISGLFSTAPYLLNEDGTYLLQENGTSKFYI
jgi:hypothetical protein